MKNKIYILIFTMLILMIVTAINAIGPNPYYLSLESVLDKSTAFYSNGIVNYNNDSEGNDLILLDKDMQEKNYENAMLLSDRTVLTYNNIKEYGYVSFVTDLGIHYLSNETNNATFQIIADGTVILDIKDISITDALTEVNVDISSYSVIQIVTTGSNLVLGNPQFVKNGNHPSLEVYDIEFSDHDQITEHTLLNYVTSFDVDGTDISDSVTYTTNYKKGVDGTYNVVYKTIGKNGDIYQRTVNILVVQTDNTRRLTIEELKQPWASYLYHGRNVLDEQGQKVFDLILDTTLDLDVSKYELITRWSTLVYLVPINLFENNIYVDKNEIENISTHIQDSEGRMYIIPDWGYEFTEKDGLVETVYVWVRKNLQDSRDEDLLKIENNTQNLMSNIKSDMTQAQKFDLITQDYANWIVYTDGGSLLSSMGNGVGKCNGNSRGVSYLAQRVGIKSIYAEGLVASVTGGHAWSYQYIPDMGNWYLTDKLWGRILAAPLERYDSNGNPYHEDLSPYFKASFSRMDEYFEIGENAYPKEKFRYPSVWIDLSTNKLILEKNKEYDIKDIILDVGSVYNDIVTVDNIDFDIINTSHTFDLSLGYIPTIDLSGDGSNLYKGTYQITLTLNVNGFEISEVVNVEVIDSINELLDDNSITGSINTDKVGLYDGSKEIYYDFAILLSEKAEASLNVSNIENIKYITFDYGIKDSVRLNTSYGHHASVALEVYVDDVLVYTTSDLGWKSIYETVTIEIPKGASTVKFVQLNKGAGNNHAAIANIKTYTTDNNLEYGEISRGPEIITEPTETTVGKVEVYCLNSGILLEQTNIYRITFKQDGKYLSHVDYREGDRLLFTYPSIDQKEGHTANFEEIVMNQNQVVNVIYTKIEVETPNIPSVDNDSVVEEDTSVDNDFIIEEDTSVDESENTDNNIDNTDEEKSEEKNEDKNMFEKIYDEIVLGTPSDSTIIFVVIIFSLLIALLSTKRK